MKSKEIIDLIDNYLSISKEDQNRIYLKVNEDIPKVHIDLECGITRQVLIKVYKDNADWNDGLEL